MRSTTLLTSALATGALANIVTNTVIDVVTTTVTVYVTDYVMDGYEEPTFSAVPVSSHYSHHSHHSYQHSSQAASAAVASSSAPAVYHQSAPAPAPIPCAQPASSAAKVLSSAKPYQPQPSAAPAKASSSQAPQPSQAPGGYGNHISGPSQAELWSGPDYEAAILYHHNAVRANHGAGMLEWDSSCETNARIAGEKCLPQSSPHYIPEGANQGQNEFATTGSYPNVTAGIVESWYKGELPPMAPYWGQESIPGNIEPSPLHLTAVIWKGTTHVGCASVKCSGWIRTFCNYYPAGNMEGDFVKNVSPPSANATPVSWSD